ncbi:MAG: hypothetical protein AAGB19_12515, partial [Cyanobacteria bacterium P01_F01_bin.3]
MKYHQQAVWKRSLAAIAASALLLQAPVIGQNPVQAAPTSPLEYGEFLQWVSECEAPDSACKISSVTISDTNGNTSAEVRALDAATDGQEQSFRVNLVPNPTRTSALANRLIDAGIDVAYRQRGEGNVLLSVLGNLFIPILLLVGLFF